MLIETAKQRIDLVQKKMNEENEKVWKPCKKLYEGYRDATNHDLHSVNLIWATIRTLLPELFFDRPEYQLKALKPQMDELMRRKNEALLNQIIARQEMAFGHVIKNTILAAHLSLGVVTWGCNSVFIDNPLAGQPYLMDLEGKEIPQPDRIALKDSFYIKRIRDRDFYPDLWSGETFEKLEWYSIAELMPKKQVMKAFNISSKKLQGTTSYVDMDEDLKRKLRELEEQYGSEEAKDDILRVRVFRMFDRINGKVYTFCQEYDKFLDESPMPKTEPVAVLKFNDKLDEFWPIPGVIQAKELQTEIEIAATMRCEHMERSAKKVGIRKNSLRGPEKSKLESARSHTVIEFDKPSDTWPIDYGTCDSSIYQTEGKAAEYFNQVMGVGGSHRGGATPKRTATAEIIQDRRLGARQQDKLKTIKRFLKTVGNGLKNCIDENLTREMEVEILGQDNQPMVIQYIPVIDVHSDYDCDIDLKELTPPNEEEEKISWIALLDTLSRSPMAFTDERLLRETLKRFGIESKDLIAAFLEIAKATMMQQIQAGKPPGAGGGGMQQMPSGSPGAMAGERISGGLAGGG